jgi:hypothetical protein
VSLPLNVDFVTSAFGSDRVATPQGDVRCFVRHVGNVIASTGTIVACDPLVFPETEPFTVQVAPGTYPVLLAVAEVSAEDQRIAFAKLQFADTPPATWQMAALPGEDPSTLAPDQILGYPVDSGTGCFMDAAAAALLRNRLEGNDGVEETIIAAMEQTYVHTWSWADVRLSPNHPDNCIAFSSGWGDGVYASYFGYSATGDIVCLVTDFDVLWREA